MTSFSSWYCLCVSLSVSCGNWERFSGIANNLLSHHYHLFPSHLLLVLVVLFRLILVPLSCCVCLSAYAWCEMECVVLRLRARELLATSFDNTTSFSSSLSSCLAFLLLSCYAWCGVVGGVAGGVAVGWRVGWGVVRVAGPYPGIANNLL